MSQGYLPWAAAKAAPTRSSEASPSQEEAGGLLLTQIQSAEARAALRRGLGTHRTGLA